MHCLSVRLLFLNINKGGSSESNDRILRIKKKNNKQPVMAPDDHFPVYFNLNDRVHKN